MRRLVAAAAAGRNGGGNAGDEEEEEEESEEGEELPGRSGRAADPVVFELPLPDRRLQASLPIKVRRVRARGYARPDAFSAAAAASAIAAAH